MTGTGIVVVLLAEVIHSSDGNGYCSIGGGGGVSVDGFKQRERVL